MDNEFKPRFYAIEPDQLTDFVCNVAMPGDIATTYSYENDARYFYICTEKNIGKDVVPYWTVLFDSLKDEYCKHFF